MGSRRVYVHVCTWCTVCIVRVSRQGARALADRNAAASVRRFGFWKPYLPVDRSPCRPSSSSSLSSRTVSDLVTGTNRICVSIINYFSLPRWFALVKQKGFFSTAITTCGDRSWSRSEKIGKKKFPKHDTSVLDRRSPSSTDYRFSITFIIYNGRSPSS